MAAVFALVGTGSLSAPEWIAGMIAGSAAFAAVLLISRELSFAEMQFLATRPLKALRSG
jgi:hypothetical protein